MVTHGSDQPFVVLFVVLHLIPGCALYAGQAHPLAVGHGLNAAQLEYLPPDASMPPTEVSDIEHRRISLPYAKTASEANKCVQDFAALRKTNITSGNRQRPFSTSNEDLEMLEILRRKAAQGASPAALWSHGDAPRTFLEMGAFDGVTESNTIMYERCLNWTGVLIEPNPIAWHSLRHRSGRTHSHRIHAIPSCAAFTQLAMQKSRYTSAVVQPEHRTETTQVPCVPLTDILTALGLSHLTFYSLDVESHELMVLQTLDLSVVSVELLLVESRNRDCQAVCPKRDAVRALLSSANYTRLPQPVGQNDVYLSTFPTSKLTIPSR